MPEFVRDYWVDWQAANQQREDEARTVAKQMPEFDLYAGICKLADSEWECPDTKEFGIEHCKADLSSGLYSHTLCGGTGRIVPFASLRTRCKDSFETMPFRQVAHLPIGAKCPSCGGRGWIPEPDVEKACWRAMTELMQDKVFDDAFGAWATEVETAEEAVIRAALAWLKEQHG